MEFIKKICFVLIVVTLGAIGYMLINKNHKISEPENVAIQKNIFKKAGKDISNAGKKAGKGISDAGKEVGGALDAPKQGANNTACSKNSQCNSNHCIAGMCQPATTAMCTKHSDCQKDEYCNAAKCHNKKNNGESAAKGYGDHIIDASCKSGYVSISSNTCENPPRYGGRR